MIDYFRLIVSIVICQAAGFIGSFSTRNSITTWYKGLEKPSFNPPNWIFAPVWTLLYLLMGISLYLAWMGKADSDIKNYAMFVFGIQLVLNTAWSIIFFGFQSPMWGFIEIIFMWVSIAATIFMFYKISPTAAYLLVPYLLWVSFASVLNYLSI